MSHRTQWPAARKFARLGVVWVLLALAGCASTPPRRASDGAGMQAQEAREASLRTEGRWSMQGRIAVSDGDDGGSGRIDWRQDGERYRIEIRAPVSRRTWRLVGEPGQVVLEGLDGGPRRGASAEELLRSEVGWAVPVADLVAWLRGARGSGSAELEFDAEARPARLIQHGWLVEYRDWFDGDPDLPRKLFATRGAQRLRLVVERWERGSSLD